MLTGKDHGDYAYVTVYLMYNASITLPCYVVHFMALRGFEFLVPIKKLLREINDK